MADRGPALPWLPAQPVAFPPPSQAWSSPDGLLAAGGALTQPWLLAAYRQGIFPWFDDDDGPILWWSPGVRAGLVPGTMHRSRRLRRSMRKNAERWHASADQAFDAVVAGCAAPRSYSRETWITPNMASAYSGLHRAGHAHSIEIWQDSTLIGGIYGVAIGQVFCGESMFGTLSNASKVAFCVLQAWLAVRNFAWLDVQMPTAHLESLGARPLPRASFLDILAEHAQAETDPRPWVLPSQLATLQP